jgi:aryl-alcohol dehydrogenase-like predicted oxidoreductase
MVLKRVAMQDRYNLIKREEKMRDAADVRADMGVGCVPFFSAGQGRLTRPWRRELGCSHETGDEGPSPDLVGGAGSWNPSRV